VYIVHFNTPIFKITELSFKQHLSFSLWRINFNCLSLYMYNKLKCSLECHFTVDIWMERYTSLHKPRLIEYIHIKHVTPVHNWIGIEMNINIINFTYHVYRYIVHLYIVMLEMLTSYCVRVLVLLMSFDFNKPMNIITPMSLENRCPF